MPTLSFETIRLLRRACQDTVDPWRSHGIDMLISAAMRRASTRQQLRLAIKSLREAEDPDTVEALNRAIDELLELPLEVA